MALNQGTYRNNNIPEYNTGNLYDCRDCVEDYLLFMSDLLVLIQYTTVSINSMSVSYMGKSCLDPSVTYNEILRMCSSMGGPWASTSRYQMNFLEVSLGTCTQNKQAHWKSSRSQLNLFLFQPTLPRYYVLPYYTKLYFLLSPRKLTIWLGSLQMEEFSIYGPFTYSIWQTFVEGLYTPAAVLSKK